MHNHLDHRCTPTMYSSGSTVSVSTNTQHKNSPRNGGVEHLQQRFAPLGTRSCYSHPGTTPPRSLEPGVCGNCIARCVDKLLSTQTKCPIPADLVFASALQSELTSKKQSSKTLKVCSMHLLPLTSPKHRCDCNCVDIGCGVSLSCIKVMTRVFISSYRVVLLTNVGWESRRLADDSVCRTGCPWRTFWSQWCCFSRIETLGCAQCQ